MQSKPQFIEFDMANFLDVPALLKVCVLVSATGLGLLCLTVFLRSRRTRWPFYIAALVTVGWYSLLTFAVVSHGIWWPASDGMEILYGGVRYIVVTSRAADFVYLAAWYALSVVLAISVQATASKFKKVEAQ